MVGEGKGGGVGGEKNDNAISFHIRSMNGTSNRRTWQVGGKA